MKSPMATTPMNPLQLKIMRSLDGEYVARSVLSRRVSKELEGEVDDSLQGLVAAGLVEGLSLSGQGSDHFRLTKEGQRFLKRNRERDG
jgi:DNA-binding PadR family transcriptional regulator